MIFVKEICYVNVENNFLTFTKHINFTRIMLGMPFENRKLMVLNSHLIFFLSISPSVKCSCFHV